MSVVYSLKFLLPYMHCNEDGRVLFLSVMRDLWIILWQLNNEYIRYYGKYIE